MDLSEEDIRKIKATVVEDLTITLGPEHISDAIRIAAATFEYLHKKHD